MCIRDRLGKVRLLTNNPKKTDAFIYGGFDLEVVDQVPIVPPINAVSYTHLRAHETVLDLVCRLLLEKKKKKPIHHRWARDT